MKTREDIARTARECLGTSYLRHGRVPGLGLDCIGVVAYVGNKLKFEEGYNYTDYGNRPDPKSSRREMREHLDQIPVKDAKLGSILCMGATHLCIVTEYSDGVVRSVLHSSSRLGGVREHSLDGFWGRKVTAAFDYRGIVD